VAERASRPNGGPGSPVALVAEFHRRAHLPIAASPTTALPSDLTELRTRLVEEEVRELRDATEAGSLVAVADALADIVYVAYGAALTYGIDLDRVIEEVHRANLSKLGPRGAQVTGGDGKVLKPATYRPPDIAGVLQDQPPLPFGSVV
jgi:predicted HAD superfamily Cof-like phosphohydrolase